MTRKRGSTRPSAACGLRAAGPAGITALLVRCDRKQVSSAVLASLLVVAVTLLAGCGQKGPLVLPDGGPPGTAAPSSSAGGTAVPSSSDDEEERTANDEQNGTENGADGR